MSKTLFRADSGFEIGLGHIKRDLVYAKEFQNVSFACIEFDGSIINEIPYPVFKLKTNDLNELVVLIKAENFTQIVIDNYKINFEFEKKLKEQTDIEIISFDDFKKPHFCDKLIVVTLGCKKEDYVSLVPKNCEIEVGKILVRDEFYEEAKIKRDKIYDYFICLGGTDTKFLIPKIIETLPQNSKIAVATTSANKNLDKLKQIPNIELFVDYPNLACIMNQSKVLHISASSILMEAMVLGSEFVAYKTADNQSELFKYLQEQNIKCYDLF